MQKILSKDAVEFIKNNLDLAIVDVRTRDEFEAGHIAVALNIDVSLSNFKEEIERLDKNKKYLIYCRAGNRSKFAGRIMEGVGFKEVYDLDDGIIGNPKLVQG